MPPFWQPPATLTRRPRHRPSSPLLNSSLLIIILPTISLLFIVFVIPWIPQLLPHNIINKPINAPQNQKAISVKKSWDSLNIILVLLAILCGVFAKRKDDSLNSISDQISDSRTALLNTTTSSSGGAGATVLLQRSKTMMHNIHQPSSSGLQQWFEYSHQQRITTSPLNNPPATGISRLRRTVSSDPYMRYNTGNSQFRFFDDLDISKFYPKEEQLEEVEKREDLPSPVISPPQTPPRNPPAPPAPPPPPPPPAKQRRTFQTLPRREVPPSPPPPPPPPPPQQLPCGREEKKRISRKRMNATKEIATAIVHLYSHRKRKRRQKLRRNFENEDNPSCSHIQSQLFPPPSPPPPPPPLPPNPSSVFHNWFKKGSKSKKIHSFSAIPTPPPPPPPTSQKAAGKPPLPTRRETGNESPIYGIPPPPPPPPFKVSKMKFTPVGGGYVKVQSAQSSRCGSPELDGEDDAMSVSREMNGQHGERASSVTCPSPDLNIKADSFIARHHDGWRLEKLNSWREKLNKAGNGPTTSRPIF